MIKVPLDLAKDTQNDNCNYSEVWHLSLGPQWSYWEMKLPVNSRELTFEISGEGLNPETLAHELEIPPFPVLPLISLEDHMTCPPWKLFSDLAAGATLPTSLVFLWRADGSQAVPRPPCTRDLSFHTQQDGRARASRFTSIPLTAWGSEQQMPTWWRWPRTWHGPQPRGFWQGIWKNGPHFLEAEAPRSAWVPKPGAPAD